MDIASHLITRPAYATHAASMNEEIRSSSEFPADGLHAVVHPVAGIAVSDWEQEVVFSPFPGICVITSDGEPVPHVHTYAPLYVALFCVLLLYFLR